MSIYRAFLLGYDDEILGFHLMECLNDREALAEGAAIRADCKEIEVWEAARLIGRVEPPASCRVRAKHKQMHQIEPEFLIEGLEVVGAAFGIYDTKDRLVAFNNRYATLRSAIGGDVVLGVPWIDLVTASIQTGTIPEAVGREKAWLEERHQARGAYTIARQTPDAKLYQVNERRMRNGGVAVIWTEIDVPSRQTFKSMSTAEAIVGRPATPVSAAGVARRTVRRY